MDIYAPSLLPINWIMSLCIIAVGSAIVLVTMSPAFKK